MNNKTVIMFGKTGVSMVYDRIPRSMPIGLFAYRHANQHWYMSMRAGWSPVNLPDVPEAYIKEVKVLILLNI